MINDELLEKLTINEIGRINLDAREMGLLCKQLMVQHKFNANQLSKYLSEQCGKTVRRMRVYEWIKATQLTDAETEFVESAPNPTSALHKIVREKTNRMGHQLPSVSQVRHHSKELITALNKIKKDLDKVSDTSRIELIGLLRLVQKELDEVLE